MFPCNSMMKLIFVLLIFRPVIGQFVAQFIGQSFTTENIMKIFAMGNNSEDNQDNNEVHQLRIVSDAFRSPEKQLRQSAEKKPIRMSKTELYNILKRYWQLRNQNSQVLDQVSTENVPLNTEMSVKNLRNDIESNYLSISLLIADSPYEYLRKAFKIIYKVQEMKIQPEEDVLLRRAYDDIHDMYNVDPRFIGDFTSLKSSKDSINGSQNNLLLGILYFVRLLFL